MKKTVVLGITSGIAAYKTLDLVSELKKEGIDVFVVMTNAARQMVDVKEFEKASGNNVYSDLFEQDFNYKNILKERKVDHIDLADRADVICIAPATANAIAKISHGIADDFLLTMMLAANSPVILSPSMNVHMWTNPVTQENIEKLKSRGMIVIQPERGSLACGYEGPGRLPHILTIKQEIIRQISYSKSLAGKKIVVTAGATKEKIDDVRFISNNSSGKMGVAIADECYLRGADVYLLRAKNSVGPRFLYKTETFETVDELEALINHHAKKADVFFHSAAVGDFGVSNLKKGKVRSSDSLSLVLSPQKKLSDGIKNINKNLQLIVFKAEWGLSEKDLIRKAQDKLQTSSADMVIANDVSREDRGFQADTNEVLIITKRNVDRVSLRTKQEVASEILSHLLSV